VLGLRVERVDYDEAVALVLRAARQGLVLRVAAANVHVVMEARADAELAAALGAFDLVVPDGQPLRWVLNAQAAAPQLRLDERVYGPELMLRVCHGAANERLPIYLYGADEATLSALRTGLLKRAPGLVVAGTTAPGHGEALWRAAETDVERIVASGARIVFVGLGCPRQERWIGRYAARVGAPCLGVGAAFDLLSGNKPMAPRWMQDRGLEWLFRLRTEPRRTWRRYLQHNPRFAAMAAAQLIRGRWR
jgi:exopolysaccharide biosynthesis WecB/TagA/CpsF family protein